MATATWNDSMPASEGVAFFAAEYLANRDTTALARLLNSIGFDNWRRDMSMDFYSLGTNGTRRILAPHIGEASEFVSDDDIHAAREVLAIGEF